MQRSGIVVALHGSVLGYFLGKLLHSTARRRRDERARRTKKYAARERDQSFSSGHSRPSGFRQNGVAGPLEPEALAEIQPGRSYERYLYERGRGVSVTARR